MTDFRAATPAFPVSEIGRAISFYEHILGYRTVARDPGFALMSRDEVYLHLWLAGDDGWRERSADRPVVSGAESFLCGTASCRIEVRGIDALYHEFREKGIVHPNAHLKRAEYPAREFAILDPDGNMITFFEMDGRTT